MQLNFRHNKYEQSNLFDSEEKEEQVSLCFKVFNVGETFSRIKLGLMTDSVVTTGTRKTTKTFTS